MNNQNLTKSKHLNCDAANFGFARLRTDEIMGRLQHSLLAKHSENAVAKTWRKED